MSQRKTTKSKARTIETEGIEGSSGSGDHARVARSNRPDRTTMEILLAGKISLIQLNTPNQSTYPITTPKSSMTNCHMPPPLLSTTSSCRLTSKMTNTNKRSDNVELNRMSFHATISNTHHVTSNVQQTDQYKTTRSTQHSELRAHVDFHDLDKSANAWARMYVKLVFLLFLDNQKASEAEDSGLDLVDWSLDRWPERLSPICPRI